MRVRKILIIIAIVIGLIVLSSLGLWHFWGKAELRKQVFLGLNQISPNLKPEQIKVFNFGLVIEPKLDLIHQGFQVSFERPVVELIGDKLELKTHILGGSLNGLFQQQANAIVGQIDLKDANLAEHPLIRLLGVNAGKLSISSSSKLTSDKNTSSSRMIIEDLSLPQRISLAPFLKGLPVSIPALDAKQIVIEVDCNSNNQCKSNRLEIISSLGDAKGSFVISELNNNNPVIDLNLRIALNKAGEAEILPALALINPKLVNQAGRPILLHLKGQLKQPQLKVEALIGTE